MQTPSPKPSYAAMVASPVSKGNTSPTKETSRTTIRIPAPKRLIQAKPSSSSASTKALLDENQARNNTSPLISPQIPQQAIETAIEATASVKSDETGTNPTKTSVNEPLSQETIPDKKALKKAKKARQAAAKAETKSKGNEDVTQTSYSNLEATDPTAVNVGLPDELLPKDNALLLQDPFVQGSTLVSNQEPRTPSPPRLTAAEKGKGKATFLSRYLDTESIQGFAAEEPPLNTNPNKRKAVESPSEPKVAKKNTNMANPPLHTPIRLSEVEEHSSMMQNRSPQEIPLPHSPVVGTTYSQPALPKAPNAPAPGTENDQPQRHILRGNDILARLPSAQDIAKAIEIHLQLKPAFSGTEIEFNKQTMRLQELLNSVIAITQPDPNIPSQSHTGNFQLPQPPQRPPSSRRNNVRVESPTTPTPIPRRKTTIQEPPQAHTQPNPNPSPPRQRRQNTPYPSVRSDSPRYLPSISSMHEEEDGVSMIDSEGWPGRRQSLPPSDAWEEEFGPPPYMNSPEAPHPQYPTNDNHTPPPDHTHDVPTSPAITAIFYEENLSDGMVVDGDPKGDWQHTETPGIIVNGVGLRITDRPPNGWIRPEYRLGPTHGLSAASIAKMAQVSPRALWALIFRANGKLFETNQQEIADAIRRNVEKLITIDEGDIVRLHFPTLGPNVKHTSRFEFPHHILLYNITLNHKRTLLQLSPLITEDLVCWFLPLEEQKTHFVGTIVGLQHKKTDQDEVLETIKAGLTQANHTELERFVHLHSIPPRVDSYQSLIANIRIEYIEIKHNAIENARAWNVILPPNNMDNTSTIGFAKLLKDVTIPTDGVGLGTFLKPHELPFCEGCKGLGHPYHKCPYHDLPGWPFPKPKTTSPPDPSQEQPKNWAELQDQKAEAEEPQTDYHPELEAQAGTYPSIEVEGDAGEEVIPEEIEETTIPK
ncbi:hypothetical protein H0H93_014998 [Arthromyces matolae]|nr:hypothetical protein H0H93_014998 [Arthromyces matolae]